MKTVRLALAAILVSISVANLSVSLVWADERQASHMYVPDERTAIAIAEAVLIPIIGEDLVLHDRPYSARLSEGRWTVSGKGNPRLLAAVMQVNIDANTGQIYSIMLAP